MSYVCMLYVCMSYVCRVRKCSMKKYCMKKYCMKKYCVRKCSITTADSKAKRVVMCKIRMVLYVAKCSRRTKNQCK